MGMGWWVSGKAPWKRLLLVSPGKADRLLSCKMSWRESPMSAKGDPGSQVLTYTHATVRRMPP
jgi:hypothetical protein